MKFLLKHINKEMGRRASRYPGDTKKDRDMRNRLKAFGEKEHRLCFAFAFLHLAEVNGSDIETAWKSFKANLVEEGVKLDQRRAFSWRACLQGVPLDQFNEKMKEAILKMIYLGTLLTVDESLLPATEILLRFWESVINSSRGSLIPSDTWYTWACVCWSCRNCLWPPFLSRSPTRTAPLQPMPSGAY